MSEQFVFDPVTALYVPTPETAGAIYAQAMCGRGVLPDVSVDQFARMIAEVQRAAAEKALSKAADDLRVNFSRGAAIAMHHECHKKQCRCGNPGNDEIVREVFEAAREAIRIEALAYRRNEGENEC